MRMPDDTLDLMLYAQALSPDHLSGVVVASYIRYRRHRRPYPGHQRTQGSLL